MEVSSLASTVSPSIPEVALAFEHEVVEPHEEIDTASNDRSQADRISKPRLGGARIKGREETWLVEEVPVVVMGIVACDGSGVCCSSLHATTERQTVIGKTKRRMGRTGPVGVKPVRLIVHKTRSDQQGLECDRIPHPLHMFKAVHKTESSPSSGVSNPSSSESSKPRAANLAR